MIVQRKNLQGGMAIIEGTRLTVWEVLQALSDGHSIEKIVSRCKNNDVYITKQDIKEAINYASNKMEAV